MKKLCSVLNLNSRGMYIRVLECKRQKFDKEHVALDRCKCQCSQAHGGGLVNVEFVRAPIRRK